MSKISVFFISLLGALLGGALVIALAWSFATLIGLSVIQSDDENVAGAGYAMLEEYQCGYGETKTIIMRGVDDNFVYGNLEIGRINERLSEFQGISANYFRARDYDASSYDSVLIDYFDLPPHVTKGLFALRVKPASKTAQDFDNDVIEIGYLGERLTETNDAAKHAFTSTLNSLGAQPGWNQNGNIYSSEFEHIQYRMSDARIEEVMTRDYKNLAEHILAQNDGSRVDIIIADDTRVDFAGMAVCQRPSIKHGVSFVHSKVFASERTGLAYLGCNINIRAKACNPIYGDTACTISQPVACFLDDNSAMPNISGFNDVNQFATEKFWSSGRIAFTVPARGDDFQTLSDANRYCAAAFGADWRVLEFHDGNISAVTGYLHGAMTEYERVWIDIKNQPNGTCWARDDGGAP